MTDEIKPPDLDVDWPMPDGLKVTRERPYRILVIADLAGGDAGSISEPLAGNLAELKPDGLDALLAAARPRTVFKLADPVRPGNVLTEVALEFDSYKAFAPRAIAERVPATQALLAARALVTERLRGKRSAAELDAAVKKLIGQQPELAWLSDALHWTPAPAADAHAVDDVLSQLDLGDGKDAPPAPPKRTGIGAVVAAAAQGGGAPQLPAEESAALRRALAQLDRNLSSWLDALLHAPAVQELEARWRGLALLASRVEFRKGLHVSVLHAPRAVLGERLTALVIDPVFDAGADAPDLIVVDASFGNAAPDLEALDELAQHAASLPAVVLAGAGPEFLGVKHAWQVPTLPAFVSLIDQWQFAKWKTLRGQPYARMLGVIFGRGLLRSPHAAEPTDNLEFAYREECLTERDCLWGSGAVVGALTVAHSVAECGWPTGIVGRLDGFPTVMGGKKGEKQFGPADTQMPLERAQELTAAGLSAVVGLPRQTDLVLCNGFSAARPPRTEGGSMLEVSLPYQLFAGRLSSLLLEIKPHLAGLDREHVVGFVLAHVRDWLTLPGVDAESQQVSVQARPAEDAPGALDLAVTVTPPQQLLPGGIPVVLGYRVS